MTLPEKLIKARKHLGKKQTEMADIVGSGHRSWQGYEQGTSFPGGKVFEALTKLGFNATWFFTDDVPMLLVDEGQRPKEARGDRFFVPGFKPEEVTGKYVAIPRYEVTASAGGGAYVDTEEIVDYLNFKEDWVRNILRVPLANLALISVTGDSMETTLSDGDVILLDTTQRGIIDSAIYALQLDGTLLVKRIQCQLNGSLKVISDNQRYEPETVTGDEVNQLKIIGRVVWAGKKM